MRKDLLIGGGAGALLCAVLIGAALSIGPLLGIDWPGGSDRHGSAEAVSLPAIPETAHPAADRVSARVRAPRVVSRSDQPTTTAPGERRATAPRSERSPSVAARQPQPTSTPKVATRPVTTDDAPTVAAPDATPGPAVAPATALATPAAAIPATPVTAAKSAKILRLRVASVAVETDDNNTPELRLGLAISRGVPSAPAPDQLTVRLRPKLPSDLTPARGPLALRAHVDVVDAPADSKGHGPSKASGPSDGVDVPGLQMRVRMALEPAAPAAGETAPTVADAGDGDGQSNVIAVSVPLAAFADPDHPGDSNHGPSDPTPAEPTPGTPAPAPAPAEPTEIRIDLQPASEEQRPEAETAKVPAPEAPAGSEDKAPDVPVTVVVDPTPQPPADTAPVAPGDPAPKPDDPTPTPPSDPGHDDTGADDDGHGYGATATTTPAPTAASTPDSGTAPAAPDASAAAGS